MVPNAVNLGKLHRVRVGIADRRCPTYSRPMNRVRRSIPTVSACLLGFALAWQVFAEEAKGPSAILIVARSGLPDPNFRDSIVLVMNNVAPVPAGLIVNRATRIPVARLFPDVEALASLDDKIYFGGPVEVDSVSFLFRADAPPEDATQVLDGMYLSTNAELLRKLLARDKPMEGLRIFAGYAGWGPGQLQAEIERGDWKLVPADARAVFEAKPVRPWPEPSAQDTGPRI